MMLRTVFVFLVSIYYYSQQILVRCIEMHNLLCGARELRLDASSVVTNHLYAKLTKVQCLSRIHKGLLRGRDAEATEGRQLIDRYGSDRCSSGAGGFFLLFLSLFNTTFKSNMVI